MEQRKFVIRHLRDFGFGRNTMATIIEYEAQKLVEHFKKILEGDYYHEIVDVRESTVNNNNNNNNNCTGQIYKLQKNSNNLKKSELHNEFGIIENKASNKCTPSTAADLYVKAEDYAEVRRVSQKTGMIVPMQDAFGVTVLNTLWRMMASKRFIFLTFFYQ